MKIRKRSMRGMLFFAGLMVVSLNASAGTFPVTDEAIETAAKDSHVFKTYLKNDAIVVDARNGTVTLNGTVSGASHKILAEETVSGLEGVQGVENNLVVRGERVGENSDGWIATKVKTTLLFHNNVDGLKTQVEVKDGVATLRGEADSMAQKDLAAEYARDIDGVRDVRNEMTVGSAGPSVRSLADRIDDASITAQVKMVLLYHRSTSALDTRIKTTDGVVTVTGRVGNAAERDLITKLILNINGVRDVRNEMTVA